MADHFDIIIIGASIAGLYSGSKLTEAGRNVCIIDRKKEIGTPVRCGEATGNRAELSRFIAIDESWIARDFNGHWQKKRVKTERKSGSKPRSPA
jgi:digeranylgeranylglycerophospholipid reductase